MKRLLLVAVGLSLAVPDLALAYQGHGKGHGQGQGKGQPQGHGPKSSGGGHPGGGPSVYKPGSGKPANFHPVRGPGYYYPPGQRYRRWKPGVKLPSDYFNPRYYYADYGRMGLGAPPPGHRWVRYGPDLLLVRSSTGIIADVILSAFL